MWPARTAAASLDGFKTDAEFGQRIHHGVARVEHGLHFRRPRPRRPRPRHCPMRRPMRGPEASPWIGAKRVQQHRGIDSDHFSPSWGLGRVAQGARPAARITSSVEVWPSANLKRPLGLAMASSTFCAARPPTLDLDLEHGALGQPEGIPDGFGQGDLPTFSDGGFHGNLLRPGADLSMSSRCISYAYLSSQQAGGGDPIQGPASATELPCRYRGRPQLPGWPHGRRGWWP